jgi:3-oxoacyl-[acyl-carrier-protein] synthase-1
MTLSALQQIEAAVFSVLQEVEPLRFGIVLGTSTSGTADGERAIARYLDGKELPPWFHYSQLELGGTAEFLARYLQTCGPTYVLSTACSSGARALASARSLLETDYCDAVLAGGTDTLCLLTAQGFSSLQAIAPEVTNPFSIHRAGLTLGEGSALFLMTREQGGIQLAGVGETSEAHHMSAPDPEGVGAAEAMQGALQDAGLQPEDIAYLNLHGTGTERNDAMESSAVARILGAQTPCSSTKSLVGHTLGAAGAMEAAFCWLTLAARKGDQLALIPHCFDGEQDPELETLNLTQRGQTATVDGHACVMSNSFGFGGNNCTVVLREERP